MHWRQSEQIPLTDDMKKELLALRQKTGWGGRKLFSYGRKQKLHPAFETSTFGTLNGWLQGTAKSANKEVYDAVLIAYQSIPVDLYVTSDRRTKMNRGEIAVPIDLREALGAFLERPSQLSIKKILELHKAPKKLSENRLAGIASGKYMSIMPEHAAFIRKLIAHYQ